MYMQCMHTSMSVDKSLCMIFLQHVARIVLFNVLYHVTELKEGYFPEYFYYFRYDL